MKTKSTIKNELKLFTLCSGLIFVVAILCALLMLIVYALPTNRTRSFESSSIYFYGSGHNRINNWIGEARYSEIDNFTDSIMLNTAICRSHETLIQNAFLNPRFIDDESEESANLVQALNGIPLSTRDYSRYWHGYLVFLIPCLQFLTIGQIRNLLMAIQLLLTVWLLYEVAHYNPQWILPYAGAIIFINPITAALNFQIADIFIISTASSALLFRYRKSLKNKHYPFFFLLSGVSVAFFDFLTYPLVAWGLLMGSVLLSENHPLSKSFSCIIKNTCYWLYGYVGMFFMKWIIAYLLTGEDVLSNALSQISYRIGGTNAGQGTPIDLSYTALIPSLLGAILERSNLVILLLLIILIVAYYLFHNRQIYLNPNFIKICIPFFCNWDCTIFLVLYYKESFCCSPLAFL